MEHLARIAVHPIKSLDPVEREHAEIVTNGGLAHDREYAMVTNDGASSSPTPPDDDAYVNGKRTAAVHRVRADYADDLSAVTLARKGTPDSARRFALPDDRPAIESWLSDHFGYPVALRREPEGGYPDDTTLSGPTIVSTATIETVASWFDGIDAADMRLRFRATLEVGGVEPFWEDRLYADHGRCIAVRVGDVTLYGVSPCQRCVVPSRDPHTGDERADFRETFVRNRERTLPDWADSDRLDHYYRLMVNTQVPRSEWGSTLAVGDTVEILDERPLPDDDRS